MVPCSGPVFLALECSALENPPEGEAQSWELEDPGSGAVMPGQQAGVVAVTVTSTQAPESLVQPLFLPWKKPPLRSVFRFHFRKGVLTQTRVD